MTPPRPRQSTLAPLPANGNTIHPVPDPSLESAIKPPFPRPPCPITCKALSDLPQASAYYLSILISYYFSSYLSSISYNFLHVPYIPHTYFHLRAFALAIMLACNIPPGFRNGSFLSDFCSNVTSSAKFL